MRCFALALALVALSCSPAPAPVTPRQEVGPAWADIFEGTPDIYAVIRPRAIKRDGVYGAFWASVMRVAQARGFTRGATMVEAASGAEEIIVGLGKGADAALVMRGVPASLDPQKVIDADGQPLFRPVDDRTTTRRGIVEYELLDRRDVAAGALFVLPDRVWIGTLGDARRRARQVFVSPVHRPAPPVEEGALAAVRFGGPLVHAFDRHPLYGPLSRQLTSATFTLRPGKGGLRIALTYAVEEAATRAEAESKRVAAELAKDEVRFGWLKETQVAHEGTTLFIRVALPPRLLEELPSASGAEMNPPDFR